MTTAPPRAGSHHASAQQFAEPPVRKLYRSADGRLLGGVARGLAGHLGLPVSWVRVVFVALFLAEGMGALLYAAFWFFVPLGVGGVEDRRTAADGARRAGARRPDTGQVIALIALLAGSAFVASRFQLGIGSGYLWPVLLIAAGVALVWRQADNARRAQWLELGRRKGVLPALRGAAGVALVGVGVTGIVVLQGSVGHLGSVLQAALAVVVGIALLAGPYLVRLIQDLSEERLMRIRAQERAEVAAHVHDSVLHTLTLIQRSADDSREVARLARAQERELRAWLYRPEGRTKEEDEEPATLADAVRTAAAEVEDHHGVPIEVVVVGDCPLDEALGAQMKAAREAMVNAAKYGGEGGPVQVFAEVEGRTVFVSVRDRGPGFDLDAVPDDRMGVRESIIGRMERNGGTARLRSVPGGGTEVELEMERTE
ncbi:ATP-binding protein [Streptomyces benahoarensis]|uniref:PspC domain-containing protein n=1 Tax=Streptomyces benahoarensis TaxID=2595054 RepID=A0A553XQ02_9ACTN|nr:ATP-binding protein [Streptomyces benahoarensis]TSB17958.1 PspC domain-containing protein [Streptomyces benahoarensis]TSB19008.1 PspC domain-containing protein [Streptomyces benahoarensis]